MYYAHIDSTAEAGVMCKPVELFEKLTDWLVCVCKYKKPGQDRNPVQRGTSLSPVTRSATSIRVARGASPARLSEA